MNLSLQQRTNSWPERAAVVISDSSNVHMLLRELLRSYHWTVVDSVGSPAQAIKFLHNGEACVVIIDDSSRTPASLCLRQMLSDPVAICTPVLGLILESNKTEVETYKRIGSPVLIEKPLTPSTFAPAFIQLITNWESSPAVALRQATYQYQRTNAQRSIKMLLQLSQSPEVQHLANLALSHHLRSLHRYSEAEKVLHALLKSEPRQIDALLNLADLYMQTAMPYYAYRILQSIVKTAHIPQIILYDLFQCCMLMGRTEEATKYLLKFRDKNALTQTVSSFLARLYYSDGKVIETDKILQNNKTLMKQFKTEWQDIDPEQAISAS